MQIIFQFQKIFREEDLPLFVQPYRILVLAGSAGLVEVLQDATSVHQLKKFYQDQAPNERSTVSLQEHFRRFYGVNTPELHDAVRSFVESLAGYSLVSFILQLRDRHNGNIMITAKGRLVHIDFGFMLSISPGGINAENAPFKLTQEYLDIMDGMGSPMFKYFKELLLKGYLALRKHAEKLLLQVEIAAMG